MTGAKKIKKATSRFRQAIRPATTEVPAEYRRPDTRSAVYETEDKPRFDLPNSVAETGITCYIYLPFTSFARTLLMPGRKLHPLEARNRLHSEFSGAVWVIDGRRVTVLGAALDARDQIEVIVVDHDINRGWRTLPIGEFIKGERLPLERPIGASEAGLHAFLEAWNATPAPIHRAVADNLTAPQEKLLRTVALKFDEDLGGERGVERALLMDFEPEDDQVARALADEGVFKLHETADLHKGKPMVSSATFTGFGWKVMRALIERPPSASETALHAFLEAWSAPLAPIHHAVAGNLTALQERLLRTVALKFEKEISGEREAQRALSIGIEPEEDQTARALANQGIFELRETVDLRNDKPIISSVTFTEFGCRVARAALARYPDRGTDG